MPVIARIIGGLGNQMFQYAMAKSLAIRNSTDLYLDTRLIKNYRLHSGFELDRVFDLNVRIATDEDLYGFLGWKSKRIVEKLLGKNAFRAFRGKNYYIEEGISYNARFWNLPPTCFVAGNWQSEKYFHDYENIIRKDFVFSTSLQGSNRTIADKIDTSNSVSVHIRRGDYYHNAATNRIHGTCPLEYYHKAISRLNETLFKPVFFIFSDDIEWVKNNIKFSSCHHYINNNIGLDSWIDMHLISLCKHHIIANSSFSWWGAWLCDHSDKIVVAPNIWFKEPSYDSKDIVPENWIKL